MSLLTRDPLPYPTYNSMLEHILSEIQDRMGSSLDELIEEGISPNVLKRMQVIARNVYEDLKITYFTFAEMVEILETDEPIKQWAGHTGVMFMLLKPTIELADTEEGPRLQIEMALDYQIVN